MNQAVSDAFDEARVQDLLTETALVQDSMDTSGVLKIREEMERAEARKLQPHYIESFFIEAFRRLGGRMAQRESRRYQVTHVPAQVRGRDRLIGLGDPVLQRYERITFEKSQMAPPDRPPAAFVCPGHPLLDATIDLTLERHSGVLRQSSVLVDDNDPGDQSARSHVPGTQHSRRESNTFWNPTDRL